jgi:hypothetical protein
MPAAPAWRMLENPLTQAYDFQRGNPAFMAACSLSINGVTPRLRSRSEVRPILVQETAMVAAMLSRETDIDPVEEMRLRTWARRNYEPHQQERDSEWHPVILDEMRRKDSEKKSS